MKNSAVLLNSSLAVTLILCMTAPSVQARLQHSATPRNLESRRWFQDAKFGLFIHWGVYSILGEGEWVMENKKMSVADYEKLPAQFNPSEFNAAEWVALAKESGMRYLTFTAKHHDGFAMFDSKVTDWDIIDRTPYKKDVLKMLADECHRQGIKLFLYYSQLDWHHPDYYSRGRTGRNAGRPESGDWQRYLDFMNAQLRELLTNYGSIAGIWFDGWWDRPEADWRLDQTYKMIHELQSTALIGSNHHRRPFPGEDFQMFEKDLPGKNTTGFNESAGVSNLPLEMCETINRSWGYNKDDRHFKSPRELVHLLARAAGSNSNLLLNIGPMPDGKIQPEFSDRLRRVGRWLAANGEAFYATRGGPVTPRYWGVTTQKLNTVYLHVLEWQDTAIIIPPVRRRIRAAHFLTGRDKAEYLESRFGLVVQIPQRVLDEFNTIVVLDVRDR